MADKDQGATMPTATAIAEAEAALLDGGPGTVPPSEPEPTGDSPPVPSQETIRLGGQEFTVEASLADAVRQREQDAQRKISEQGAELGTLRKLQTPPPADEPAVPSSLSDEEAGQLLFEKPAEFVNKWVSQRIDAAVEAKAQEFRQEQYRGQFWQEFYTRYPELKPASAMVETVFRQSLPQWADLQPEQVFDQLAQGTRDAVGKLLQAVPPPNGATRTTVESSSASRVPKQNPPPVTAPTLTELIRKRRKSRMVGR